MLQQHLFLSAPDRSLPVAGEHKWEVEDSHSEDSVVYALIPTGPGRCSVQVGEDQWHHVKASGLIN